MGEVLHDRRLLLNGQPSVQHADARTGEGAREALAAGRHAVEALPLLVVDQRAHPVDLLSCLNSTFDEPKEVRFIRRPHVQGLDGLTPRRQLVQDGDGKVTVDREDQGPWNGRGGHHQDVRRNSLGDQGVLLPYTKAVLFVNHGQTQLQEVHLVRKDGVGPNQEMNLPRSKRLKQGTALRGMKGSRQEGCFDAEGFQHLPDPDVVLLRQHLGWSHQDGLRARIHGRQDRSHRDQRFSRAHVPLKEAIHGDRAS